MPRSQTDGDSWIPTVTNRDSNLPDLLWVNTTWLSGETEDHRESLFLPSLLFYTLVFRFPLTCFTPLALSHPAQQGEQLAAITHSQTQGVVPPPETIKLSFGLGVVRNSSSPTYQEGWKVLMGNYLHIRAVWLLCKSLFAFSRSQHICVAKSTNEHDCLEGVQS